MTVIFSYFVQFGVKNDRSDAAGLRNENIRVARLFRKGQTGDDEERGRGGREIKETRDFNRTAHFNFLIYTYITSS